MSLPRHSKWPPLFTARRPSPQDLPPPLPRLIPVTRRHSGPLADMSRRRDKLPRRRRHIAPAPPAPVVSVRLACADADRCEAERADDSRSRDDPLQFHRELLISWLPCRCQGRRLAKRLAKTARRSRLFPDLYIVPPAAFASHIAWPLRYLDSGTRSPRSACDHAPGAVSTWMTSCSGSGRRILTEFQNEEQV